MRIDAVNLYHVALPLRTPLDTPAGPIETIETVLVEMRGQGNVGWGEAAPGNGPLGGPEWAAGVFACLRDWLAPAVIGASIDSGEELQQRLECFQGNRFAKASLDTAWWDLQARGLGKPLHELLGGEKAAVEVGAVFGVMDSIEDLLAALQKAFDDGFARAKLKVRPGWDIQMVAAVREHCPIETVHVDVDGTMTLEHSDTLYRFEDFGLAMIEQPFRGDDLVGHAMIQESLNTPLCLDEGVTTVEQAEMAAELKSCRFVNVKPGRVGGVTPAVAIHDVCRAGGIGCWVGAARQSAVGARIDLALATKANFTYPADYFPAEQWLQFDLAERPQPQRQDAGGKLALVPSPEPGIGVEPDRTLLEKACLAKVELGDSD